MEPKVAEHLLCVLETPGRGRRPIRGAVEEDKEPGLGSSACWSHFRLGPLVSQGDMLLKGGGQNVFCLCLIKIEKQFTMRGVGACGPLTLGSTDCQAGCLGHACQSVGHSLLLEIFFFSFGLLSFYSLAK